MSFCPPAETTSCVDSAATPNATARRLTPESKVGTNWAIPATPSATTDVIAGHVPLMMANIVVSVPHVRSNRLRAYGVTSAQRSSGAPDLPTIIEMGLPGYVAVQWYSLVGPAALPRDIVMKINAEMGRAVAHPEVTKLMLPVDVVVKSGERSFMSYWLKPLTDKMAIAFKHLINIVKNC